MGFRKGVKKRLKGLFSSSRSQSESPAATPSRSSTPQAMGSQPANPAPNEPPMEPTSQRPPSEIDASNRPPLASAGTRSESNIPLQPEGTAPVNLPHESNTPLVPPTSNEPSGQETLSMGTPSKPNPSPYDRAKDQAGVAWSFTQALLKRAHTAVDTNPVKVVFGLAHIALDLKKGMQDNMDATDRRIAALLELMIVVNEATQNWHGSSLDETRAMEAFKRALSKELNNFFAIQEQSKARQFLVQEDDKQHIADIFERVNEARENMILATGLRAHWVVVTIDQKLNKLLRKQLSPSYNADHKSYLEGKTAKSVRRVACTPGTRPTILSGVKTWANDPSKDHSVYWLFGPAGTGKTTVACTIARRFEFACDPGKDNAILGANFFCSRQFPDTRSVVYVVRTIVYQLCLVCKAFADAYEKYGNDTTIHQDAVAQLEGLLVNPWKASEADRIANNEPIYLVGIDAVDELENNGGSKLITALLNVQGKLQGLKFFITSREDRTLAAHAKNLGDGNVCRLQEVSPKEADDDVRIYLMAKLGHIARDAKIEQLVKDAAGLFIYAATVVEYVVGTERSETEQKGQLGKLLTASASRGVTATLDTLYLQILEEALKDNDKDIFEKRLHILYMVLCTVERTSPSVVDYLLGDPANFDDNHATAVTTTAPETIANGAADVVVGRLHAVLYKQGDQVMWLHKSFLDFMFDEARSTERFYRDQESYHRLITKGCFRVMREQLCFNIANIPDSSIFDCDNLKLQDSVKDNISPALSYACRSWSQHLIASTLVDSAAILKSLHDFLQLPILFWIETMNLIGQRGLCEGMLCEAQRWAALFKELGELAMDLRDAASFAIYFSASPAAASTPHLYLSALATFPQPTQLRATWRKRFGGIPAFANAIHGTGGSPLMTIKVKSEVLAVAVSPDGSSAVTGSHDRIVQVWDLSTGEASKTLKGHSNKVTSVAFSPDGTCIVSGSWDNTVRVWDALSGEELKTLKGHSNWVTSVAFSPDGTRIVSGSWDNTVRVWDALSGEELKTLQGHSNPVTSVAFLSDGTRIVSGSYDNTVRVWDALSGEELKTLEGHSNWVTSVAFSPDGTHIVSGSYDNTVRVWDALSGEELKTLKGHTGLVNSVASLPDSTHIVSGSSDKTVRMWHGTSAPVNQYTREKLQDDHTGWLLSPNISSGYLMFVPLSECLPDDSNILTIPHHVVPHIKFSKAKLCTDWVECYTPVGSM